MATADFIITTLTITDPSCAALQESLDPQPVMSSDPEEDLPTKDQVIKMLLQGQSKVVSDHCITLFNSLGVATHHISVAMANLSALAKLVDVETFKMILRASACPLVQINIDEDMLDPTKEKPTPSKKETCKEKLRKTLLPDEMNTKFCREPANSATCLFTAAVYLKLKKDMFNEGTQVEAVTKFNIKSKTRGQILSGKCYWGSKDRKAAAERKSLPAPMSVKPPEEAESQPTRKRKRMVISSDED